MDHDSVPTTEVFSALGDPIRWRMLQDLAHRGELPFRQFEESLPVSKPTIAYHAKILAQAGLIDMYKRGRSFYCALRSDMLDSTADALAALMPNLYPEAIGRLTAVAEPDLPEAVGDDIGSPGLPLTW